MSGQPDPAWRCPDIGCTAHPGDVQVWERPVIDESQVIRETGAGLFDPPTAAFDLTRTFRYHLTRTWEPSRAPLVWIMLNPSTADADEDDRTIGRCAEFARRENAGGISVVNLFAFRATKPAELRRHRAPVGGLNDAFIVTECPARTVVAAWGAHGTYLYRDREVAELLAAVGVPLRCLGVTAGGHPRHPLYVRGDAPLVPYHTGLDS
jgi:hypothetical protein